MNWIFQEKWLNRAALVMIVLGIALVCGSLLGLCNQAYANGFEPPPSKSEQEWAKRRVVKWHEERKAYAEQCYADLEQLAGEVMGDVRVYLPDKRALRFDWGCRAAKEAVEYILPWLLDTADVFAVREPSGQVSLIGAFELHRCKGLFYKWCWREGIILHVCFNESPLTKKKRDGYIEALRDATLGD